MIWSLRIMRPFIEPVLWGVIIAVAVFPAYNALATTLGWGRIPDPRVRPIGVSWSQ